MEADELEIRFTNDINLIVLDLDRVRFFGPRILNRYNGLVFVLDLLGIALMDRNGCISGQLNTNVNLALNEFITTNFC